MKSRHNMILILSSGGMILSCFCACTSFILICFSQTPLPVSEAGVTLFMATLITSIHSQKGWNRIYVIGLHIFGLLFAFLRLCHNYYRLESSFWNFSWVQDFFLLERSAASWFVLILILLCVWILWFCGIRLFIKPTDQTTISHRFDLGLAFLLFLLLIKLTIAVKASSISIEHSSTRSLLSFIVLGLFSMGLVRIKSTSQTGGVSYFKGAGIVLSFTAITLMLGGGLFILFLPGLQTFAEASSGLLKTLKQPIEHIVVVFLEIFFHPIFGWKQTVEGQPIVTQPVEKESGILEPIFYYLMMGLTITILLAMAGFILYRLLKWLFSKIKWLFSETVEEKDKKGIWDLLLSYVYFLKSLLSTLWLNVSDNRDTSCTAEKFYKLLLRWGRFSGLSHVVSETPKEYGLRLGHRFPQIEKEIRLIIHVHDEAIYGCISPDSHQIALLRRALRRIRNPFLWFARMKSFCFHDRF